MKKIVALLLVVAVFTGCAESLRDYLEEPQSILRDPHFAAYQEKLRAIEHSYLINEIDYAEYLEKKKELDDQYAKEVQEREARISGQ